MDPYKAQNNNQKVITYGVPSQTPSQQNTILAQPITQIQSNQTSTNFNNSHLTKEQTQNIFYSRFNQQQKLDNQFTQNNAIQTPDLIQQNTGYPQDRNRQNYESKFPRTKVLDQFQRSDSDNQQVKQSKEQPDFKYIQNPSSKSQNRIQYSNKIDQNIQQRLEQLEQENKHLKNENKVLMVQYNAIKQDLAQYKDRNSKLQQEANIKEKAIMEQAHEINKLKSQIRQNNNNAQQQQQQPARVRLQQQQQSHQNQQSSQVIHFNQLLQNEQLSQVEKDEIYSLMLSIQLQEREERDQYRRQLQNFRDEAFSTQLRESRINPDQMSYEQLLELQDRIGYVSKGLTKEQIKSLLKKVKIDQIALTHLREFCSICCSGYQLEEKFRQLPCSHQYHSKCIKSWLLNQKTCPVCKFELNV